MTTWPKDRVPDRVCPVVWSLRANDWPLPRVSSSDFDAIFGTIPGQPGNRLRTWGHPTPDGKGKPGVPHYIATRGGTPLHYDPAYPRYSVQLAIANRGLALSGWDGRRLFIPTGCLYCLDTHSPHQVTTFGENLLSGGPRQKLQAAIDYDDLPDPDGDYTILRDYITSIHPTKDALR